MVPSQKESSEECDLSLAKERIFVITRAKCGLVQNPNVSVLVASDHTCSIFDMNAQNFTTSPFELAHIEFSLPYGFSLQISPRNMPLS